MEKRDFLYDGRGKQIYATDDPEHVIILFKDDTSAHNDTKRSFFKNKGFLNNRITEIVYTHLESDGIRTHFVKRLDTQNQLCKRLEMIPLEFIIRNVIAGTMARRLDVPEGTVLRNAIFEICLKNRDLQDPMINKSLATALGFVTEEELLEIYETAWKINDSLICFFDAIDIKVIDFKMEFGRDKQGHLLLADEISPDSARFWDKETNERLDKDRFRRDLGKVEEGYKEVLKRLENPGQPYKRVL